MVLRPRVAFIYSNVVLWPVWQNGAADASGWVTSATGRIVFPHLFSIFSVVDALLWAVIYNKTSHFMFTPSTGISVVRLVPDPSSIFYDQIHRCQWVCECVSVCIHRHIHTIFNLNPSVFPRTVYDDVHYSELCLLGGLFLITDFQWNLCRRLQWIFHSTLACTAILYQQIHKLCLGFSLLLLYWVKQTQPCTVVKWRSSALFRRHGCHGCGG